MADTKNAVMPFLVLETQGELYAVRWALVRQVGVISSQEIDLSTARPEVRRNGGSFPLYYLWELVGLDRPKGQIEEIAAVFLEEKENRMILAPDRILWKQEADLRMLPQWLKRAPVVAGVIALNSGVAVVVVEPFALPPVVSCEAAAEDLFSAAAAHEGQKEPREQKLPERQE